jgi:hypothetical protein
MTPIGTRADMDEGCNTVGDGGAGILFPVPQAAENCLMVRVGGFSAAGGRGILEVSCEESACFIATAPEPEYLDLPELFDPPSQKVRYLSFTAGEAGHNQAVRVTMQNLPAPYASWNGTQMFVGPPAVYCENAGTSQGTCPSQAGGLPPEFLGATLQCEPYFTDWSTLGVVHVFHEGIIPAAEYHVQAVDDSCLLGDELSYSLPWVAVTSPWADCVQDCTTTPCKPPDGSAAIADVTAILDKFKNLQGNVIKARADIEGSPAGDHRLPDQSINITDVTYCLGSFLGEQYPAPGFPPPSEPPSCP